MKAVNFKCKEVFNCGLRPTSRVFRRAPQMTVLGWILCYTCHTQTCIPRVFQHVLLQGGLGRKSFIAIFASVLWTFAYLHVFLVIFPRIVSFFFTYITIPLEVSRVHTNMLHIKLLLGGVLDCPNFGCCVSSRCRHIHCIAMRNSIKVGMNWHKTQEIKHTPGVCSIVPIFGDLEIFL